MPEPRAVNGGIYKELRVQALAHGQDGVAAHRQLLAIGWSATMIAWRVKAGRLHPKHRGVYAVGRSELSQRGVFRAAALAIGDDAVIGYFAAAYEWGFWTGRTTPVDIIVPRRLRSRPGIRVHQVTHLPPESTTRHHGLLLTTPARTALDLAAVMYSDRHFMRTVHEAQAQRRVTVEELRAEVARAPRHPGAARLVRELEHGPTPTRSGLEDANVELLRRHDFPPYDTNVHPPGTPAWVEVDVLFRERKLAIEVDSERWHGTSYRRRLDAHKQSILEQAGYVVLRLTEQQLEPESEARTVALICRAYARAEPQR